MGRYLACGIATSIAIRKSSSYTDKELLDDVGKNVDLNIYNIKETEKYLILDIKEKILEDNLIIYIQEQLSKFASQTNILMEEMQKLEKLKGKSYNELMELSKEYVSYNFQMMEGCPVANDITYISNKTYIFADIICYISDGKIIMEDYNDLFTYLRNARISTSNNKIRTATIISIIG